MFFTALQESASPAWSSRRQMDRNTQELPHTINSNLRIGRELTHLSEQYPTLFTNELISVFEINFAITAACLPALNQFFCMLPGYVRSIRRKSSKTLNAIHDSLSTSHRRERAPRRQSEDGSHAELGTGPNEKPSDSSDSSERSGSREVSRDGASLSNHE